MKQDRNKVCYELLMQVFRDNAYASIALNAALKEVAPSDKAYVTKLFYGVLERNVYYEYILQAFAAQKPKKPVATLIKMGYYLLENTSMPPYAAVNNIVSLCKAVGKGAAAGFINKALREFAPPALPPSGTEQYLSVAYSYPLWLTKELTATYGYDFTQNMLAHVPESKTHIRVNTATLTPEDFDEKYVKNKGEQDVVPTFCGYYMSRTVLDSIPKSAYVVQSLASVAAVYAYTYDLPPIRDVLDLCAAPGGKAVLTALRTGAAVTACDIYAHRVEMIRKYAFGCDARVRAVQNDATVPRAEWAGKFDLVLCDVPCSGIGVAGAKPDILYNRAPQDIEALARVQARILETAAKYVKKGGRLCYSTCTVLRRENEEITQAFAQNHPEFARVAVCSPLDETPSYDMHLFPHTHGCDGFYVAVFKRL